MKKDLIFKGCIMSELYFTNVNEVIQELLLIENKSIFELAKDVKINPTILNRKLSEKPDTINELNKFTLLQLIKIADNLNCELSIDFKHYDNDGNCTIFHCKSVEEGRDEVENEMSKMWDKIWEEIDNKEF